MTDEIKVPATYSDDALVYVDPDAKKVVGLLEWNAKGNPKPLKIPEPTEEELKKGARRRMGDRFYPWGTYRSLKRVYQLDGKQKRIEGGKTLDEILPKALENAFWND